MLCTRYDNMYDWDLSEQDKLAAEYTTGVDHIEPALGPPGQGDGQQEEETNPEREQEKEREQPSLRIMSRTDKSGQSQSLTRSGSQRLSQGQQRLQQEKEPPSSAPQGRGHGYHTRTASNAMR